jgi:hypothetical protein
VLVNSQQAQGSHQLSWDAPGVARGGLLRTDRDSHRQPHQARRARALSTEAQASTHDVCRGDWNEAGPARVPVRPGNALVGNGCGVFRGTGPTLPPFRPAGRAHGSTISQGVSCSGWPGVITRRASGTPPGTTETTADSMLRPGSTFCGRGWGARRPISNW